MRADTAIYNSILRLVAVDGGGPDALEAVVAEMQLRGVRLDRRTYFLLLRGYGATGELSCAMDVMRRMAHDGAWLTGLATAACYVGGWLLGHQECLLRLSMQQGGGCVCRRD